MARGVYILKGQGMTVLNAAVTLAFIRPSATVPLEILRVLISQDGSAVSAQQSIQIHRKVAVMPTLVSATPEKTWAGDAASSVIGGVAGAAGTSGINASAEGAGAETLILPDSFNVLNGWLYLPSERERPILEAAAAYGFAVKFPVAPATFTRWNVAVIFRELA